MSTPRVFIIRHGETEWSLNGRHTGSSDIPLTSNGEKRLLNLGINPAELPWSPHGELPIPRSEFLGCGCKIEITEDVREWDYGDYEGITSPEIRKIRADQGYKGTWDIWKDGCPGGESPQDVTDRLDRLINDIRQKYQAPVIDNHKTEDGTNGDVLIVAHGHILRALATRWVGKTLQDGPAFLLEAGGVGTLSYEHHKIDEPAILLGGSFVVDSDKP
ncbi:sedoheptulose-bisphosphatase [Geosmithia morbida]|uniref:Sedoheptulose-bisphosphatase n=1 Tax=Geosmithia morbida TaxID=1094350 RepID=A0A9P4YMV1_9HYPO|nr:sedoheptulose-bisphosphatase [Geosmithia morbida]KAF4119871.1 sedoheptulose-bisphosphatase [Geosmithia morbida]